MKKAFYTLLFIAGLGFGASAQSVTTGPVITLDKEVHDYGTIQKGANGQCQFTVTNTGTEPLIITSCKGSCGCTVPQCDKSPILPGNTSSIAVKYDTNRVGPINKSVTISSNATNEPSKIIRIKGTVEAGDAGGAPVKPNTGAPVNN
ncbi:MAG: hypothetical protein RL226_1126 [Bacteroidota bacterium]|jgi:hypothetical protein